MWPRAIHRLVFLIGLLAVIAMGCASPGAYQYETREADDVAPPVAIESTPADDEMVYEQRAPTKDMIDRLGSAIHLVGLLDYDGAARRLGPLAAEFEDIGDAADAAKALFWLGYCHEKRQRLSVARGTYRRAIDRYGDQPAAAQARRRLEWLDQQSTATGP